MTKKQKEEAEKKAKQRKEEDQNLLSDKPEKCKLLLSFFLTSNLLRWPVIAKWLSELVRSGDKDKEVGLRIVATFINQTSRRTRLARQTDKTSPRQAWNKDAYNWVCNENKPRRKGRAWCVCGHIRPIQKTGNFRQRTSTVAESLDWCNWLINKQLQIPGWRESKRHRQDTRKNQRIHREVRHRSAEFQRHQNQFHRLTPERWDTNK